MAVTGDAEGGLVRGPDGAVDWTRCAWPVPSTAGKAKVAPCGAPAPFLCRETSVPLCEPHVEDHKVRKDHVAIVNPAFNAGQQRVA